MTDWPVGLSTGCFYKQSIFEVLESIRDGGFSMIEICSYPPHLDYHDTDRVRDARRLIDRLGMEPFSFHAPFADHIDITAFSPERREQSVKEITCAVEAAALLGVRHFVIHPGPEKEGKPPRELLIQHLEHAADSLNQIKRRCGQLGMTLILENMLPHLLFGRTSDLLWIMGALEPEGTGLCLDTGHANLAGDLYTAVQKMSGHLHMLHASDNGGRYDDHLPPGRGNIRWETLLRQLEQQNFRGGFILELSGDTNKDAQTILREAREARGLIRSGARDTG